MKPPPEPPRFSDRSIENICITIGVCFAVLGLTATLLGGCAIDGYYRTRQAESLKAPLTEPSWTLRSNFDQAYQNRKKELKAHHE